LYRRHSPGQVSADRGPRTADGAWGRRAWRWSVRIAPCATWSTVCRTTRSIPTATTGW